MIYREIVFDIDGTLIDTEYAVLHSLKDALMDLSGEERPLEALRFALGIPGADALVRLGIQDISFALALWEKYMRRYEGTVSLFPGIPELLERLASLDCRLGILTSKTKAELKLDFSPFGLDSRFSTIVCADDTETHKPSPAPLLKYIEWSGVHNRQILYVGDSEYDSQCAKSAGVDFALAVWGSHRRSIKADYYLFQPTELFPIAASPHTKTICGFS